MLVSSVKTETGEARILAEDIVNMVRTHLNAKGKSSRITNVRVSFDIPSGGDYSGMNYEFEKDDFIKVTYTVEDYI